MIGLAESVTSTPNGSLAGAAGAGAGAGAAFGGGASGAGWADCANADEAKPSANSAARVVTRQGPVIQSLHETAAGRPDTARKNRPNLPRSLSGHHRKAVIEMAVCAGSGHHLGISHINSTFLHSARP